MTAPDQPPPPEPEPDNPYAAFVARRALGPVVREEIELTKAGDERQWFGVYTWDAVRLALGDPALSVQIYGEVMGLENRYGPILLGMDPPQHREHRAVLQPTFSRQGVSQTLRPTVARTIDDTVAALASPGSTDLLTSLCEPMPTLVLARLFGLPDGVAPSLAAQATAIDPNDLDRARAASDALFDRLRQVIDDRRRAPGEDLVSVLAHASVDGRPLTDAEVFSHLRMLAIAGTDTVSRASANLLFALLTHPDQLDAVRRDRRLLPAAVDESVRWECPAVSVPRLAVHATRIVDIDIPEGAAVRCVLGSANRDPGRWAEPDRFDIGRPRLPNAGFGLWAHACLGVHLAHEIMGRTVRTLLARLPNLRLADDGPPPVMDGQHVRAPTHLRVSWD